MATELTKVTGWPLLVIFGIAIAFVLVSIIKFRLNPFVALLLTSILTAFLVGMPIGEIGGTIATGFGNTLKGIGIVIGLGIILGRILSESGATERIAHFLIDKVGQKNSPLALTITGYLVSIPVFVDAAFVILISVVKKVSSLTRTPAITLVTALSVGLITTHNMVVPTPGPVEVANSMKVSMGIFVLYAVVVAVPAALLGGWLYGLFVGRNVAFAEPAQETDQPQQEGKRPSSGLSFFTLLLPILLILFGSILTLTLPKESAAHGFFAFIGNKNIALLISVLAAILLMGRYIARPINQVVIEAAERSGMILLITGAGGAFGYVINQSGIGDYIIDTLMGWNVSILVIGFLLSAILRGALGSATVALVTASSMLGSLAGQTGTSPVLVALAVCAGGSCLSLPNDSAFWVVTRFSDFKINETFKGWTVGGCISGVVAFIVILLLNAASGILPGIH